MAASATAFTVLLVASASLWLAWRGTLITVVRGIFRAVGIGPSIYRHAYGPLDRLARAVRVRTLTLPILVTSSLWCGLYALAYALIGRMVGIQLGYLESLILVFVGTLGLALPAAPSGIGTFHASIVSGFLLLGREPSEGLILAVAIHGAFFIALLLPGTVAYFAIPLWKGRRAPPEQIQ